MHRLDHRRRVQATSSGCRCIRVLGTRKSCVRSVQSWNVEPWMPSEEVSFFARRCMLLRDRSAIPVSLSHPRLQWKTCLDGGPCPLWSGEEQKSNYSTHNLTQWRRKNVHSEGCHRGRSTGRRRTTVWIPIRHHEIRGVSERLEHMWHESRVEHPLSKAFFAVCG
jgi:hypothetical protein